MTVNMTNPERINSTVPSSKQKGSSSKKKSGEGTSSKKKGTSSKKSSASSKKGSSSKGKSGSKLLAGDEAGENRILKTGDQEEEIYDDSWDDEINDVIAEEKDLFEEEINNFDEKELFSADETNKLFLDKEGRHGVMKSLEHF